MCQQIHYLMLSFYILWYYLHFVVCSTGFLTSRFHFPKMKLSSKFTKARQKVSFFKRLVDFLMIKSHLWGDDWDNIKYDTRIIKYLFKDSSFKMNPNLNILIMLDSKLNLRTQNVNLDIVLWQFLVFTHMYFKQI